MTLLTGVPLPTCGPLTHLWIYLTVLVTLLGVHNGDKASSHGFASQPVSAIKQKSDVKGRCETILHNLQPTHKWKSEAFLS